MTTTVKIHDKLASSLTVLSFIITLLLTNVVTIGSSEIKQIISSYYPINLNSSLDRNRTEGCCFFKILLIK